MHVAPIIIDLAIILGVAGVVMLCCRQLKQPLVLGYLLAGIIVGPYTPYVSVTDVNGIKAVAEMGVIFLMFSIGLDFSFHKLKRIGKPAVTISLFEVFFMLMIGYGLGRLLHWSPTASLFLGAALSISSTTIIIKALTELKLRQAPFAELIIGVLVVEDLLAILLLIGLPLLAFSDVADGVTQTLFYAVVKLILVIGAWFLIGYFIVPTVFKKWIKEANDEVLIVISVALCFGMVWLATFFNYSAALGAFIMGSILAETAESVRIERLVQPLRDVYAAVFFVAIGMLIDPAEIWQHLGTVLLITLVTILGKTLASFGGAYFSTRRLSTSAQVGLSLAQIGEFSFIITGLGVSLNLLNNSFYAIIVAVSVLTTFTTPYFIRYSTSLAEVLQQKEKPRRMKQKTLPLKPRKLRATLQKSLLTYLINLLVVAIIFSLLRFIPPLGGKFPMLLLIGNLVFAFFYLCAAPFIAMLFITPLSGSSLIFKIGGVLIALLELYFLLYDRFALFSNFMIWFGLILILSFGFHRFWHKNYTWLAAHLLGNLKQAD